MACTLATANLLFFDVKIPGFNTKKYFCALKIINVRKKLFPLHAGKFLRITSGTTIYISERQLSCKGIFIFTNKTTHLQSLFFCFITLLYFHC
jgi:hypothetical protein